MCKKELLSDIFWVRRPQATPYPTNHPNLPYPYLGFKAHEPPPLPYLKAPKPLPYPTLTQATKAAPPTLPDLKPHKTPGFVLYVGSLSSILPLVLPNLYPRPL